MKNGRLQIKDISTLDVLQHLYSRHVGGMCWSTWCKGFDNSIDVAMGFPDLPDNLVRAKMKSLIQKGLVSGCYCGCRGDYEIQPDGIEWLKKETALGRNKNCIEDQK